MTSPDSQATPNPENEGGGMLPALLAGAGILLVAGLLIFGGDGGDDDQAKEASEAKTKASASASAQTASGPKGGVTALPADDANSRAQGPRLNPRIANAIVTEGMAPAPTKKPEPTSFASSTEEIIYWEEQLRAANSELEMRLRASETAPRQEEKIREHGSAEDLVAHQNRMKVVNDNLERAQARVAKVEDKLAELR